MSAYVLKIKQWLQIIQQHYWISSRNTLSGCTGVTGRNIPLFPPCNKSCDEYR